jgi:predicted ArsR family transcriptional regulator
MKPYGSTVADILKVLETVGPMTRSEICHQLGLDRMNCSAVITRMAKAGPKTPRRLHISGYTHDSEHGRCYPRAIYDLGDKPDAKKPNRQENRREARKRSDKRRAVHNTMNFVFNLAVPRRLYRPSNQPKE